jgi:fluoride exporter
MGHLSLYFWIAIGGALGTLARFALSGIAAHHLGETFPWGTLLVNVSGSLIIGFFATFFGPEGQYLLEPTARHFVMTGVLGGYTTFSSFSLQTLTLAREGDWLRAGVNAVGSLILCLIAVWLGHIAAVALSAKGS